MLVPLAIQISRFIMRYSLSLPFMKVIPIFLWGGACLEGKPFQLVEFVHFKAIFHLIVFDEMIYLHAGKW